MDCFNDSRRRRRRRRRRRQTLPQYTHNKKYKKMVYEGTIRPQLARQIDCSTRQQTARPGRQLKLKNKIKRSNRSQTLLYITG